ncbi:hypothetical protein NVP1171O_76 [Vibrio phage 1.171.O._10N.261.52.F12]|nr:hypothetical protein NVP1171O_76 [Vibrio phage 1.171.O._10N.261.52.F12]
MSNAPTSRTITDPTLGTITVEADADTLRLVITWDGYGFGFQYDDVAVLAARYTEITDEEILVLAQSASDEINGTDDRVLH